MVLAEWRLRNDLRSGGRVLRRKRKNENEAAEVRSWVFSHVRRGLCPLRHDVSHSLGQFIDEYTMLVQTKRLYYVLMQCGTCRTP